MQENRPWGDDNVEITTKNPMEIRPQGEVETRSASIFQPTIISPFGPTIYYNTIAPECFKPLLSACEEARKKKLDVSSTLAGVIKEQYDVKSCLTDPKVIEHINHHCHEYLSLHNNIPPDQIIPTPHEVFEHTGIWVNYQKSFEYQPEHAHSGFVSYVIYMNSPLTEQEAADNPYDQRVDDQTRESLAGKINFHYGERQEISLNNFFHFPQEGDIIMFPSWLGHSVHPFFKDGVERISVSGNISLINNT